MGLDASDAWITKQPDNEQDLEDGGLIGGGEIGYGLSSQESLELIRLELAEVPVGPCGCTYLSVDKNSRQYQKH